jgi:hypothetical protein
MAGFRFALLAILIAPTLALAQSARAPAPSAQTEDVTVNGLRNVPDAVIDKFIGAMTSPAAPARSRAGKPASAPRPRA